LILKHTDYDSTQNYWLLILVLPPVLRKVENSGLDTGCVPAHMIRETIAVLGPLERANISYWMTHVSINTSTQIPEMTLSVEISGKNTHWNWDYGLHIHENKLWIERVVNIYATFITIKLLDFVHRPDFYKKKTQRFGNWICFRLQARGGGHLLDRKTKSVPPRAWRRKPIQFPKRCLFCL
jgi:hypothetical protein